LKKKIYGNPISFLSLNKHSQQPASTSQQQPITAANNSLHSQPASTYITSMFNYGDDDDYGDYGDYVVNTSLKNPKKLDSAKVKVKTSTKAKAKAKAKVKAKVKASTKNLRTVGNNYKQFVTTQSTPQEASWDWNGSFDPDLETYDVIVFTVFLEDWEYPITWW